jgi:hypothetical protein
MFLGYLNLEHIKPLTFVDLVMRGLKTIIGKVRNGPG